MAKGGGSLSDSTAINLMAEMETTSEYRALSRTYQGEQEAQGLGDTSTARRREGRSLFATSVLSSATSLAGKYG
jgi:hypothetical protein